MNSPEKTVMYVIRKGPDSMWSMSATKLGPDAKDDKTITILNICLEWKADSIHYEANPRHAEI